MNKTAILGAAALHKIALDLDIQVGDILLGGRFKNKRIKVKSIGTDELGQPTVNGKKLLNFRIEKTLPFENRSKETRLQQIKK